MESVQFIPQDGWKKLEFDKVIGQIQHYCISEQTKSILENLTFYTSADHLSVTFDKLKEWNTSVDESETIQLGALEEISEDVFLLRKANYVLSTEAILRINKLVQNHRRIRLYFTTERQSKYPLLFEISQKAVLDNEVYVIIDKVFTEEGEVKDSASTELQNITRAIKSKQRAIDKDFNLLLSRFRSQGLLTDSSESYRSGRRVLSVPSENKRKVKGGYT